MALDTISLTTFRNHSETALGDTRVFNLLVGENGAGKTNILEAISLLSAGRGLRRAALPQMAGHQGAGGFTIGASLDNEEGETVRLGTFTDPARPGRRMVRVNGADTSAASLGEWLAISWLTPAMDRLFTDSAGARRRYLDRMTLALEPGHGRIASRYENALRERGRMLAGDVQPEAAWFDAVERQIAEHGAMLGQGRARLVSRLTQVLEQVSDHPFARPLLQYCPGGPLDAAELTAALKDGRQRDYAANRTLTGPHRDELAVIMAGTGDAAALCSTGEQKAMLIAITLAHAQLAAMGRPGILLLDEVAAHLDPVRRAALFERLRDSGSQIWLTGTELAPFAEIADEAAIWRVSDGELTRL